MIISIVITPTLQNPISRPLFCATSCDVGVKVEVLPINFPVQIIPQIILPTPILRPTTETRLRTLPLLLSSRPVRSYLLLHLRLSHKESSPYGAASKVIPMTRQVVYGAALWLFLACTIPPPSQYKYSASLTLGTSYRLDTGRNHNTRMDILGRIS